MRATASVFGLFLAVLVAAGGGTLPAATAFGEPARPCITIVAPAANAALPPGRALVVGAARGEGVTKVEIDVDGGQRKTVAVTRGAFTSEVKLSPGKNVIRVAAGKSAASVAVLGDPKGAYRYHPEVEKCDGCHNRPELEYAVAGRRDEICYRCHDRQDGKKNVHGPLGGGECTACHDPHGSANAALTTARAETLCVSCHDQESSADHLKRSKGKACTSCHEPHSSDRRFLGK